MPDEECPAFTDDRMNLLHACVKGYAGLRMVWFFEHDAGVTPLGWGDEKIEKLDRFRDKYPLASWTIIPRPRNPLVTPRTIGDADRCIGLPAEVRNKVLHDARA